MSQANQLLPISTSTTVSTGVADLQAIEKNGNSGEDNQFSSLLKSEIAQKESVKSSSDQVSQVGNTTYTEGQKLPQDGKSLPVTSGFYILGNVELAVNRELQTSSQSGKSIDVALTAQSEIVTPVLQETPVDTETATESLLEKTENTTQNTVNKNETDSTEMLTEQGSEQTVTDTNTQALTTEDISSRSALPEASVVGQQKAVENILKHSETVSDEDNSIQSLRGNGREVSARLAALMQKQDSINSETGKVTEKTSSESLDADQLLQEMNDGKKLFDSELNKANIMRFAASASVAQMNSESMQNQIQSQNVQTQSGSQAVTTQPVQTNIGSNVTQSPVIEIPLKQQGWDQAMGHRVVWQINQKIESADIRLNPAHLGPLEVKIKMTDEGANVTFSSHHGVVRDALEAALPKLREMLEGQGINLANADVSEQN
ncbi:MAG: flagellar hook-length control protein FliK, partial [Gammaproteobacteria bacterium]|nr:flagellar hook-length control protein FliK [Gammaproteobacteria bacterium]